MAGSSKTLSSQKGPIEASSTKIADDDVGLVGAAGDLLVQAVDDGGLLTTWRMLRPAMTQA